MQPGKTLVELATTIQKQRDTKVDYIAPTSNTAIVLTDPKVGQLLRGDIARGGGEPQLEIAGQGTFPINRTAHVQIANRLNIPVKYYDRMLAEAPGLLAYNANTWLERAGESRMVRTLDGNVRAYLSDRYQRIDNAEIAEVALPVLAAIPNVQIVSTEVTEHRMYIQAVSPRVEGEVKKGDVVQAGVVISNSEIGHGAVSVLPMIWRLICLNGAIASDGALRAYHVGRRIEDTTELWADDTRKADDRAILLKVRDMVAAAVDQLQFDKRLAQMQELAGQRITGHPVKVVEQLAKRLNATEPEQGGILRALTQGGDLSAWGLINAVTAQAHEGDYDRAIEFGVAGGKLIDLPANDWHRLLAAA
jgi:hypothetical protein